MFLRKLRKIGEGFSLVELLVVLVIIGILAAVATPLYLHNTKRAKASEAISMMGVLRQAERDYKANHDTYFDVTVNIANPLPTSVASGVPAPTSAGLAVDAATAKYFSNDSYEIDATSPDSDGTSGLFALPAVQDFLITARGADSVQCISGLTKCATAKSEVVGYQLEMDNSGRTFVRYTNSEAWGPY